MGSITIKLMSDLCAGNGESVGYGIDNDICTDSYGFPFIPGKRILGCLRDAAVQLGLYGLADATEENISEIFGDGNGKEGKFSIGNGRISEIDSLHEFIRALKRENQRDYLIRQCTEEKIIRMYSSVRGQTKIDNIGKAERGSLRFVRVLNRYNPINGSELEFICIADASRLSEKQISLVEKSCLALHHIGLNRNRGLGSIRVIPDLKAKKQNDGIEIDDKTTPESTQVFISYKVAFDSPVTVQEYLKAGIEINSRTLIGVFSGRYLKIHEKADLNFQKLFLDGTVRWSALTPVIEGITSGPVPAMIMKLKNENGKLINIFSCDDKDWKKKKPKSLDGYYAASDNISRKLFISQPETEMSYHNRMNELDGEERTQKGLYMQESLKQGLIYGGYVIAPKELLTELEKLFSDATIRLGRSKKVQYGSATICNVKAIDYMPEEIEIRDQEVVIAVLRSNLVLQKNALFQIDHEYVRSMIAEKSGFQNQIPDGMNDICRYTVLTGYHRMWQMQKPKVQAVMGGSVYCFWANKGKYPSEIFLGEYQQEGMGRIELIPMSKLDKTVDIIYGNVSMKKNFIDDEIRKRFEKMLLLEAVIVELNEYAFRFKKMDDKKNYKERILKDIPTGRLRQMLIDAEKISDLWKMVEDMKTSDISSESKGKRAKSLELLKAFYGEKDRIDFERLIENKELLTEVKMNSDILKKVEEYWKEPLRTLLHMVHYQTGRS